MKNLFMKLRFCSDSRVCCEEKNNNLSRKQRTICSAASERPAPQAVVYARDLNQSLESCNSAVSTNASLESPRSMNTEDYGCSGSFYLVLYCIYVLADSLYACKTFSKVCKGYMRKKVGVFYAI